MLFRSNTSFAGKSEGTFNPVARWKMQMSPRQVAAFEALVGDFLQELGYTLDSESERGTSLRRARLRASYFAMFEAKHWMRANTPLGRLVRLGRIGIEPETSTLPPQNSPRR